MHVKKKEADRHFDLCNVVEDIKTLQHFNSIIFQQFSNFNPQNVTGDGPTSFN